jgi:hypothetical protein
MTDPLKIQRNQLATAERSLTAARANLKAAAERQGPPTKGMFADTEFVPRTTAERWVHEAKISARDETIEIFKALSGEGANPYAHLRGVNLFPHTSSKWSAKAAADFVADATRKARGH